MRPVLLATHVLVKPQQLLAVRATTVQQAQTTAHRVQLALTALLSLNTLLKQALSRKTLASPLSVLKECTLGQEQQFVLLVQSALTVLTQFKELGVSSLASVLRVCMLKLAQSAVKRVQQATHVV